MAEKYVTVICTTPWGERHEFKAHAYDIEATRYIIVITAETATGQTLLFQWSPGIDDASPYAHIEPFHYELSSAWRRELGLEEGNG